MSPNKFLEIIRKPWYKLTQEKIDFMDQLVKVGRMNSLLVSTVTNIIIPVLEKNYPERWQMHFNVTPADRYSKKDVKKRSHKIVYSVFMVIHYPEVTVVNGHKMETTMYDLFAEFEIYMSEFSKTEIFVGHPLGRRTTFTAAQYNVGYVFSHLGRASSNHDFTPFCLGTSELNNVISMFSANPTEKMFELLMYTFDTYLCWESLEGGPYIRMSEIGSFDKKSGFEELSHEHLHQWYTMISSRMSSIPLEIIAGKVVINEDELSKYLYKLLTYDLYTSRNELEKISAVKAADGTLYPLFLEDGYLSIEKNIHYDFRDKRFNLRINDVKEKSKNNDRYVSPQLSSYFKRKLEGKIRASQITLHYLARLKNKSGN